MKIVHVITRLIVGGAQENTLLTCEGLQRRGYDVTLISGPSKGPEGDLSGRAARAGYRYLRVGSLRRHLHPILDLIAGLRLVWLFARLRPRVVHTHSSKAGVLGRLAARVAGVPRVVHTVHGLPFHPYQGAMANLLYRASEWVAGLMTDLLICVGREMKEKAVRARMSPAVRTKVVYSGMEVDRFGGGPPRFGRRPRIAVLSRLQPLKGHDLLFEAFGRLLEQGRDLELVLIGDGVLKGALETEARRRGWEGRITFTGRVNPEEVPNLLRQSDMLVHTSLREGLPRACVQALLCARPVVAFDIDGAREVVLDGVTGRLVRRPDALSLERAIDSLLRDPAGAKAMGREGASRFSGRFDHREMVSDLDALYRSLGS